MKLGSWFEDLRARMLGPAVPGAYLGAIGKHPGWDDHMEAIGLDTEPLVATREILYVRGIGEVINKALWENDGAALPEFDHVFCWTSESDTLLGRMWSSTDGKGRDRYPMLAVVHLEAPFSRVMAARALQALDDLKTQVHDGLKTDSPQAARAEDVRALFAASLKELREALSAPSPENPDPASNPATTAQLMQSLGLDEEETLVRALYAIQSKAEACALSRRGTSGKISLRMLENDALSQHVRLPMDAQDSIGGIAFWQEAVTGFTRTKLPLLFIHPVGRQWLDLIIGGPTKDQLRCIKATDTALASATPYTMDDAFRRAASEFIGKLRAAS